MFSSKNCIKKKKKKPKSNTYLHTYHQNQKKITKKSQVRGDLFTAQMLEFNFKMYTVFYFILQHGLFIV